MNRRVLFVDDEPQVLRALERTLMDKVDVSTATSGHEALRMLAEEAPFAAIVSDMRMPGMDGAELLARVRKTHPDVTRVLLTGYSDFGSTIQAVNEGNIFRFLVKPCPEDQLERALEDAIGQHSLIVSERELLERTLTGAVSALVEVLSIVDPSLFARAERIERLVRNALDQLEYEPRWAYEMAAKLSQLGCVALPKEVVQRVNSVVSANERDRTLFESHPEIASRILRSIPRLEIVADIIRYQLVRDLPTIERREISQGVELLRVSVSIDALMQKGANREAAVEAVLRRNCFNERTVVAFLPKASAASDTAVTGPRAISLSQLKVGMTLHKDVLSSTGTIVVPAGREVTTLVLERLLKFSEGVGIEEPLHVNVSSHT